MPETANKWRLQYRVNRLDRDRHSIKVTNISGTSLLVAVSNYSRASESDSWHPLLNGQSNTWQREAWDVVIVWDTSDSKIQDKKGAVYVGAPTEVEIVGWESYSAPCQSDPDMGGIRMKNISEVSVDAFVSTYGGSGGDDKWFNLSPAGTIPPSPSTVDNLWRRRGPEWQIAAFRTMSAIDSEGRVAAYVPVGSLVEFLGWSRDDKLRVVWPKRSRESFECIVCFTANREMAVDRCRHLVACEGCFERLRVRPDIFRCPYCRVEGNQIRVYIP
ncbi:hypothetical protein M427DRAFT_54293 [Gonapodya prolifera JEL478]|uniref:RING-type domain-containing protein n=1 Tax=Gonapodya prolifera (strain JEL478) TaxID=1344416 RepID=A0A139AMM4_GONPJ|nr:hypothetical protein M427DRAFT_54293 [Gonapodya prolifera JEL478]|eukprot:KXS17695.1 hypothetical protein M427DRAFT_54293 [Gonapodya prolifera JEL478]